MKKSIVTALVSMCVSCELLDQPLNMNISRLEAQAGHASRNGQEDASPSWAPDPCLRVSAIRSRDGYDWRRDTAWDAGSCELALLRIHKDRLFKAGSAHVAGDEESLEELVVVETGRMCRVSAEADLHHIIGGHLYTEYADSKGTTIGRDGKELLSWPERELLVGLAETPDGIYTLGHNRSGDGLTLRFNGIPLLMKGTGRAFGSFDSSTYGQTGALYEDDGKICCAYRQRTGSREEIHIVRGTDDRIICSSSGTETLDAKSIGGQDCMLINDAGTSMLRWGSMSSDIGQRGASPWVEGELAMIGGQLTALGTFRTANNAYACGLQNASERIIVSLGGGQIYLNGESLSFMGQAPPDEYYQPLRRCGTALGTDMILVLTPRNGGTPELHWGGRTAALEIDGYLSGIAVEIDSKPEVSPPS